MRRFVASKLQGVGDGQSWRVNAFRCLVARAPDVAIDDIDSGQLSGVNLTIGDQTPSSPKRRARAPAVAAAFTGEILPRVKSAEGFVGGY
jgi:hypothetical protein